MSETYINYKYEPSNGALYQEVEPDNYGLRTIYQFDETENCYYSTDGVVCTSEFVASKHSEGKIRRVMTMPLD